MPMPQIGKVAAEQSKLEIINYDVQFRRDHGELIFISWTSGRTTILRMTYYVGHLRAAAPKLWPIIGHY